MESLKYRNKQKIYVTLLLSNPETNREIYINQWITKLEQWKFPLVNDLKCLFVEEAGVRAKQDLICYYRNDSTQAIHQLQCKDSVPLKWVNSKLDKDTWDSVKIRLEVRIKLGLKKIVRKEISDQIKRSPIHSNQSNKNYKGT